MKFAQSTLSFLFAMTIASSSNGFVIPTTTTINPTTTSTTTTISKIKQTKIHSSSTADTNEVVESEEKPKLSKKQTRLQWMKSPTFHRRGFKENRDVAEQKMNENFQSDLVTEMKSNDHVIERNGVKAYLAKDFGFCWGVERSIALSYEAVDHYPGKTIHLTNELIHNPEVNEELGGMGVKFIEKVEGGGKRFDTVEDGDVVILPAFGASYEEMDFLDNKNVELVDTTCPWVSKVWNTVDTHQKNSLTSVIHGKYAHEETVATTSFCEDYICVKNYDEASMVADYIVNGGDREEFLKYFENAVSPNFDPDTMLKKVGLANQTTMYKKETRAIGQLLQKAMMKKYGPVDVKTHYMEFDTICDATQERQDAVSELVENASELNLDFILVVGGWDSSNTAHLLEIPHMKGVRSFHIDRAERIGADNTITHRTVTGEIVTEPFLENVETKDVVMGVTSGASTPDSAVQAALSSIFLLKDVNSGDAKEE